MIRFFRNSIIEKLIKKNLYLFYFFSQQIGKLDFLLPFEEEWFFFKELKIKKNTVILDIGAHIGESVKTFRKFYQNKIYCFEPNRRSFYNLKKNLRYYKNLKFHNHGISSKKFSWLYTPKYKKYFIDMLSSSNLRNAKLNLKRINIKDKDIIFVKEKLLFKKSLHIKEKISIIKIDVEGAEYDVLISLKKLIEKHSPIIFVEYHEKSFKKIFVKFKNYRFFYYIHSRKELVQFKNLKEIPNIFKLLSRDNRALNLILIPKSKNKNIYSSVF